MDHWIGVDLDGTLAQYAGWTADGYPIGDPIPAMWDRVYSWLKEGKVVKIFTARASEEHQIPKIKEWFKKHSLPDLEITNVKDYWMTELWDDRAHRVEWNTGRQLSVTSLSSPKEMQIYHTFHLLQSEFNEVYGENRVSKQLIEISGMMEHPRRVCEFPSGSVFGKVDPTILYVLLSKLYLQVFNLLPDSLDETDELRGDL